MKTNRKIMILTGTRADYGLLKFLISEIHTRPNLDLCLVVTGSHLSASLGMTVKEIEEDGFPIAHRLEILSAGTSVVSATANALDGMGRILNIERPDILVVLGDRYESFAATSAAALMNIPVAHIHGGELTLGAVDDALRHSMSKMAWWHFTSTEIYRQRVVRLGEDPSRVFNFGAMALDAISGIDVTVEELERSLGIKLVSPVILATLHPETRFPGNAREQVRAVWDSLQEVRPGTVIFTKANADAEGQIINETLEELFRTQPISNSVLVASLGQRRYLGLLKKSDVVIGNSSSIVIEAPMVGTPAINIGRRQEGRVRASGVLDVAFKKTEITHALEQALKSKTTQLDHPFGVPGVAKRIVEVLATCDIPRDLAKGFYE